MNSIRTSAHRARIWLLLSSAATALTLTAATAAEDQKTAQNTNPAAPQQVAAADEVAAADQTNIPENVLVTGSLIHGTVAVGTPVTTFGELDFKETGSTTIGDLFKDVPSVVVIASPNVINGGGYVNRGQNINIRNLSQKGTRTLMLIDGMRFPNQGNGGCQTDPSIIPQLAVDHLDLLTDGASATYGSDAIAGVINVHLRRGYEGALSQIQYGASPDIGHGLVQASQLYGRKWGSGDVTVSFEWYHQDQVKGTARPYFTQDFFAAQGLDNRMNIINARPGIISTGAPATAAASPAGFPANFASNCINCYSIPLGQNGTALTWSQILANKGTQNEINVFSDGWSEPEQQRAAATMTFDQNITKDIQFFADAWYSNRRAKMLQQASTNSFTVAIPSSNPFYPAGAPAGIRVSYDLALESPNKVFAGEIAGRYDGGFNVDLPYNWTGKVYAAISEDREYSNTSGVVNPNMVSAALGNTVGAVPATPNSPGIPAFTKPSNVPYLNLFCDPLSFTCNDPSTVSYITGYTDASEHQIIHEYGVNADGPLFDLPGGQLKMAMGGTYLHNTYFNSTIATNANNAQIIAYTPDRQQRSIWAGFAQVNVPIFGGDFTFPLLEKLEVEGSVRYDSYDQYGSTTNPKVAFDWTLGWGFTVRGSWGTAFRAPSFQEAQNAGPGVVNTVAGANSNTVGTCPVVGVPAVKGSIAALIDPNCSQALQFLGGLTLLNAAASANAIRAPGFTLAPETAQNVSAGFDFAPDYKWFRGLDIQATYWFIKIRDKLQGYFGLANVQNGQLDDPNYAAAFLTPANDPKFNQHVLALLGNPLSTQPLTIAQSISFIADGAIRNIGWQSLNGVDFNVSYDWDMGNWGAWNTGIAGTYNIDNKSLGGPGQSVISLFTTPVNGGTDSGGRLRYRARLGWASEDGWTVTGFMNFLPHFNSDSAPLPPVCFLLGNASCASSGLPQFAQYTTQYTTLSNYIPGLYTFDLSIGYKTGERPESDYLKNLNFQLIFTNILNKQPPFQYAVSPPGGGAPHAFFTSTAASELGIDGRVITFAITKAW